MRNFGICLAVTAGALATAPVSAALLSDDFEVDSSASYTIVDDGVNADSTSTFAFDYIAAGIPLAPNSTAGDVGGLRMTANDTAAGTGADHITAFHNTGVTGSYRLSVDIWMNVEATGGTTEFSTVGVAGDGVNFNSIFTPIVSNGYFVSMTGEGGSSSDFRHSTPGVAAVPSGDSTYLNSTNTTNATGDTYLAIFPGGDFPGSPGNRWTTLTIDVDALNVTYSLDGQPFIQTASGANDGQVSLTYNDLFSSVAAPLGSVFVVYDNLNVEVIPEPASLALMGLGGLAMLRRR